ncbi:hypothetical protein [Streptomyces spectabilis]|uniref:Uncharacterized protein n=1 Tax=Streptomyces spectabilis TaxID=68270 RepID=A0A5P2X607_STRST|nr:hypothetical protein [Streptomyces spectabilis]MBB5108308.1 hypothetical protein [Streptomyces spectabilis]MCI3901067.1 hypothetical protein [Streptomyces spectabilis]QEV58565.1 hypothetical protein CP982_07435 [Streptomyces spectabilis]GGV45772.1 hypothetical protein GCM10010245_71700 [Streptomyces spectabilis]
MALIGTLVDTFNDNVIGPEWGNSYGGATETGGRARLPCVAGQYSGYQTAKDWTLAGSSAYVQLPVAAAANGASTEAQTAFQIIQATAGTYLSININTVAGTIRFESNVGYTDGSAVSLTYNSSTHAWLRIRETGGNVLWDTSTDGSSWTNRRTLATPAWVTSGTNALAVELLSYRNNGSTNFSEFDNFNTAASSAAVYLMSASLTADGAQTAALTPSAVLGASLDASGSLDASATQAAVLTASLSASSRLGAQTDAAVRDDLTTHISEPHSGWTVTGPWI